MTTTDSLQIYPDYYNSPDECALFDKNYNKESNNPRYKNFKQIHFTCGDEDQFYKYLCNENGNENPIEKIEDNLFYDYNIFSEWDKYKNLNNLTMINTFKYMFEKFKKGIYVKIINNELKVFLPFSNINFINEWSTQIKIDPKYADITEFFKYVTEQEGYNFNKNHINIYMNTWYSNNCLLRYEYPINEGDTNISAIKNMLDELCKNKKIPDIEFFINRRDYPVLSKDGYEPYYHLWNSYTKPLISHNYDKYLPILSMSSNENFADILIPTYEDWIRLQNKENKWFPKSRQVYDNKVSELPWKNKKLTAVFRGTSTGEGVLIETNQRLKVAYLSHITEPDENNIPYLDAGITKWNLRPKKLIGHEYLQVIDINNIPFGLVNKLSLYEQSEYKYIIHIDGNVSAFRLSYQLNLNSVILLVKSSWKVWFSEMLKPYVHYVPIKEDLSDIITQIKWCRDNEDKCMEIINNANSFYNKYLQKNGIFDYFQKLFVDIKKNTGIYFNNVLTNLDIQLAYQKDFLLNKKYIRPITITKNITESNIVPYTKRTYPLLYALQQVLHVNPYSKDKLVDKDIIFNNKLGMIRKAECMNFNFIIKTTDNPDKIKEHIHESFIGINVINNIIKDIPNFAFIFDIFEDKSFNIVSEYISEQTFQQYIMGENFKFSEFLNIILQVCLALEVAQENCCFVHNDLTPWNICLKYLNEPTFVDYKIKNKVITIKTSIIPVIIDYGKSHVIYNNQHYGIVNMFNFSKSFDMLTLFITSVYQLITSQVLPRNDFFLFLKFTNFISNTKYYNKVFKNSKDVKTFFYSAKKYTNLINSNKFELDNYTPIDLCNYILDNLTSNSTIKYSNTFTSFMNIGNSGQIINYIFASSVEDRFKSFLIFFKNIKKLDLSNIHPLFITNIISILEKQILDTFEQFKIFCNKEGINNILKYKNKINNIMTYLQNIYTNQDIILDLNVEDNSKFLLNNNFDKNIFFDLNQTTTQILKNKELKDEIDIDKVLCYLEVQNIVQNIILNPNIKFNKRYITNKYANILSLDRENILNKVANINTLEYHSKILYNANIEKFDKNISIEHNKYFNQIQEILNVLGQ